MKTYFMFPYKRFSPWIEVFVRDNISTLIHDGNKNIFTFKGDSGYELIIYPNFN